MALTTVHVAPALSVLLPPVGTRLGVPTRTAHPGVLLTFDDGPHPRGTPAVLDRLAAAGASAAFFFVGEQVRRRPTLVAEVAAAGHTIALHGDRHRSPLRLGPRAMIEDLRRGLDALATATGAPVAMYRPPYGHLSTSALLAARRCGLAVLLWSRHGGDWRRGASARSIVARLQGMRPGDVVLLHDSDSYSRAGSWKHTEQAIPRLLEQVAALNPAVDRS
ncbi:MAG TPA: polysaccharide deacetylase family protein [Solirubrobacteraceae bacterium]|nr:polysaccharide deacetylase family protein [Solirubrobacteraceae bacterium]